MATTDPTDYVPPLTEQLSQPSREVLGERPTNTTPVLPAERLRAWLRGVSGWTRSQLVRLSFWGAILLPVVYVPLLLSGTGAPHELVLGLIGAHIVALLGGRSYHGTFPP